MTTITAIKSSVLSGGELSESTNWPAFVIEDYLNIHRNISILSTHFQWLKLGTQATTPVYAPLIGWATDKNQTGFTFDSITGEVNIPKTGIYVADCWVMGDAVQQIDIQLELWDGSTWNTIGLDSGSPSAQIPGLIFDASLGFKVRLVIKSSISVNIDTDRARLTLRRTG